MNGENETFDFIVNVQNQSNFQILDGNNDITDSDATIFVREFAELGTQIATVNANDPNATLLSSIQITSSPLTPTDK